MPPVSVDSMVALGFALGLRHAIEADHLAAISTIVTERRSVLSSLLVGASWGCGHTLSLLIAGVGVLLLRYQMTDRVAHVFELCVGVMLVVLGANVLRTLAHHGANHTHDHTTAGPRPQADVWLVARPLFVGMVHGLAGSAPLLLLAVTAMSSPGAAFSYIAVFGVGSIIGMTLMSFVVGVPARLTVGHFARTNLAVRGFSGLVSVGLGVFIVYENAVLNRLFA